MEKKNIKCNESVYGASLYVFVVLTIIFACFATYFFYQSFKIIQGMKGSGVVESIKSVVQKETVGIAKTEEKATKKTIGLEIIEALYWTPKEKLNVTNELRGMVVDNRLEIVASNDIKGDPEFGVVKKLRIIYRLNDVYVTKEFTEGDKVVIP